MSSNKCYYHPNMDGIYRCPRCNKDICAQCKKTYGEISRSEGTQTIIENEMCPVCYYEYRIMEEKTKASTVLSKNFSIIFTVMLVFFDILLSSFLFIFLSQSFYFPLYAAFLAILPMQFFFVFGLLLLKRMRREPSDVASLKYQKEKFLERSFALQNYLMQNR